MTMKLTHCLLVLLVAIPVMAIDIPELPICEAHMPINEGSIWVSPDGSGPGLEYGYDMAGEVADVRITLLVLNGEYEPIANLPYEDLWLQSESNGLTRCVGGTVADHNTDQNGETTFSGPFLAGGSNPNPEKILVMIFGDPLVQNPLSLFINSPDINGDLAVNLSDISAMTQVLNGDYDWSCDFNNDGAVNLSDIVVFATCLGAVCP